MKVFSLYGSCIKKSIKRSALNIGSSMFDVNMFLLRSNWSPPAFGGPAEHSQPLKERMLNESDPEIEK